MLDLRDITCAVLLLLVLDHHPSLYFIHFYSEVNCMTRNEINSRVWLKVHYNKQKLHINLSRVPTVFSRVLKLIQALIFHTILTILNWPMFMLSGITSFYVSDVNIHNI